MRVLALGGSHDAPVEVAGLVVFGEFALVAKVGLARDDVVGDGVGGFGSVGPELVHEAVGRVLRVAGVVGVGAQLAVEVEGGVVACHEGAVDWDVEC